MGRFNKETKGSDLVQEYASRIQGKVILTTGVSPAGLGSFFVEALAKASPKLLILAGRNPEKIVAVEKSIKEINSAVQTRSLKLDLSSFKSTRAAAKEINDDASLPHIDVLVNNAGIMAVPYKKTEDGFESTWQCNQLSHFLFTNLIMSKVLAAPEPRIVIVSSDGYRLGHVRHYDYNFHDGESYNKWAAYGQSKTANNLFARELAARLGSKGLVATSIHPGVIFESSLSNHLTENDAFQGLMDLDQHLGMPQRWEGFEQVGMDQGIATHVFAGFAPEVKEFNGAYLEKLYEIPYPEEKIHPWARGELEQKKVWELCEKHVGQKFSY